MRAATALLAPAAPLFAVAALLLAAPAPALADGAPVPRGALQPPHRAAPRLGPTRDPDPWFGPDKALHFCASAALAGGGYGIGALTIPDVPGRLALGAAVALGAGITKETLDAFGFGTPSWRDFAWDVLGTAAGLGLSLALDWTLGPAAPGRAPAASARPGHS